MPALEALFYLSLIFTVLGFFAFLAAFMSDMLEKYAPGVITRISEFFNTA